MSTESTCDTRPDETTQVLIVGGSLVGLSTSLLLAWHGVRCLLLERHPGRHPSAPRQPDRPHHGAVRDARRRARDSRGRAAVPRGERGPARGEPGRPGVRPCERTIAWINRCRRLSKDFEHHLENSEAMVYWASVQRMLHHLASPMHQERPHRRRMATMAG